MPDERRDRPLDGVEVLDVGTLTPGRYASFLLAELGARVVRVERPGTQGLSDEGLHLDRGKRSIVLDLRAPRGREVLERLAARADVLIESWRPGVAERLGLGAARLRERNPRLVYCALSGFGRDGPYRDRPAYDLLLLALSGVLDALSDGATPRPPGTFVSDGVSGLVAALAITAALHAREHTGEGRDLDLAMLDGVFSLLSVSHGVRRAGAEPPPSASPLYDVYEAADGRFVALAAIRPDSCRSLFRELGREDLADRAWKGDAAAAGFLRDAFRSAPADAWVERLVPLDVEIAAVLSPSEAFDDPQLRARRMVVETAHSRAGAQLQIGSVLDRAAATPAPAPAPGADTEAVLRELGYEPDA